MATVQKIHASLYAIAKRIQGYHLLKNPKGTSPTEVNMIKEDWYGFTRRWDDVFHITRIKKTFSKDGNHEEKRFLFSTHYMDVDNLEMTKPRKKNICYSINADDKYSVSFREDIPFIDILKQKIPILSKKRSGFLKEDSEYDTMYKTKCEAQLNRGYYKKGYSLFTKIVSFGMYKKMCYPKELRPNFFKILYQNLTNKPKEQNMIKE